MLAALWGESMACSWELLSVVHWAVCWVASTAEKMVVTMAAWKVALMDGTMVDMMAVWWDNYWADLSVDCSVARLAVYWVAKKAAL